MNLLTHPKPKALLNPAPMTHEEYVRHVRDLSIARLDPCSKSRLASVKLTYGIGENGVRGVTYFDSWQNHKRTEFIEICAKAEQSPIQLVGTTIHEFAHCLAGRNAGHGQDWKRAAAVLGLETADAAGQDYKPEHFAPELLAMVRYIPLPTDGAPLFNVAGLDPFMGLPYGPKLKPCPLGIGTRGGKSRGKGSGSRLRLFTCECGIKVRTARDEFDATCNVCHSAFKRAEH